jgi:phytoene dehydrogenase-like protein
MLEEENMQDVLIIGAGLAGLAAARHLKATGHTVKVIEAENCVGGREKTDYYQGFLLDHGFHVFLTAYPEAQDILQYADLKLHTFYNGALIWSDGKLQKVADPWRHPLDALPSIMNSIGELSDKLKIKTLKEKLSHLSEAEIFNTPESSTADYLKAYGFTPKFIQQFFKPFLGGIFLESELETSSRFFEFVFKMFSQGDVALPAKGIQAIPLQLASALSEDELLLNNQVTQVQAGSVKLSSGTTLEARAIIIATDAYDAKILVDQPKQPFNGTTCLYFSASEPPVTEPILVLNGTGHGIVNNLCVPTLVCPAYSNTDRHLISVSLLGTDFEQQEALPSLVQAELKEWFGQQVEQWEHLKTYRIPRALPTYHHTPPKTGQNYQIHEGVFRCGDYLETPSINGALASGRLAAEKVSQYLTRLKIPQ